MGVLVKYRIENLTADDIILIGSAIDTLPHGKVQNLVHRMQAQITTQDTAERSRIEAEQKATLDAWRAGEIDKLRAELAKTSKSKKRGH